MDASARTTLVAIAVLAGCNPGDPMASQATSTGSTGGTQADGDTTGDGSTEGNGMPTGSGTTTGSGTPTSGETSTGSTQSDTAAVDCEAPVFPDPALDAAVRTALGVAEGPIPPEALATLEEIDAHSLGIIDLSGVEAFEEAMACLAAVSCEEFPRLTYEAGTAQPCMEKFDPYDMLCPGVFLAN